MITGVIRRNTLNGLIKLIIKTNSAYDYHQITKDDHKHKTDMLIYAGTLFLSVYFILFLELNMYSDVSIEEYLIAFPIYTSLVLIILFIIEKVTFHHNLIECLNLIFQQKSNLQSDESIYELRLNKIYAQCIEESYLFGTCRDIQRIDQYIQGLNDLLKYRTGYSLKFTTPINFIKITVFFLAGFIGSVWSESFRIGDFSHVQQILSILIILAACALITLEFLCYLQFSLSEKKKINRVCEHLIQIKYMIIDSTREKE